MVPKIGCNNKSSLKREDYPHHFYN